MPALIVFVTVPNRKEATRLAKTLVGERLAACVNIIPGITSHYRWKGKVERGAELLLVMKTTRSQYAALQKRILELHSYSVPEIVAFPITQGSPDYLKWIVESVKK